MGPIGVAVATVGGQGASVRSDLPEGVTTRRPGAEIDEVELRRVVRSID